MKEKKSNIISKTETKIIYESDINHLIHEFIQNKQDSEAESIPVLRNDISSYLFEYLTNYKVPNYFVNRISKTKINVRKTEPIPISIKIYNYVTNYLEKSYDAKIGTQLRFPIFEYYYLNRENNKIQMFESHVIGLDILPLEKFRLLTRIALKAYSVLKSLFERRSLILVNIEFEFGMYGDNVLICGELSPLTFSVWNLDAKKNIQQNYFNFSEDNILSSYQKLKWQLIPKI